MSNRELIKISIIDIFDKMKDYKIDDNRESFPFENNEDSLKMWIMEEIERLVKFIELFNSLNKNNIDCEFEIYIYQLLFELGIRGEDEYYIGNLINNEWYQLLDHFKFNEFLISSSILKFECDVLLEPLNSLKNFTKFND